MSGLAWLNDSTILAIVSEAGGVCSVQNLTSVAPDWQLAPVTVNSSGPLGADQFAACSQTARPPEARAHYRAGAPGAQAPGANFMPSSIPNPGERR